MSDLHLVPVSSEDSNDHALQISETGRNWIKIRFTGDAKSLRPDVKQRMGEAMMEAAVQEMVIDG